MFVFLKLLSVSLTFVSLLQTDIVNMQTKAWLKDSTEEEYTEQELYQFIYDRTFSLLGSSNYITQGDVVGTGWLFKHEKEKSNYSYLLFTNWHVSDAMKKVVGYSYAKSDTLPKEGSEISETYRIFETYPEWHNASYEKDGKTLYGYDVAILEVTFNLTSNDTFLKNRLDRLNTFADSHNNFLFNGIISEESVKTNDKIYVGGYPLVPSYYKDSNPSDMYDNPSFYYGCDVIEAIEKRDNHEISTDIYASAHAYDTYSRDPNLVAMGGGCSGSVGINKQGKVMGILWGGNGDKRSAYAIHSYEVFSRNNISLYDDYINNKFASIEREADYKFIIFLSAACVVFVGSLVTFVIVKKRRNRLIK